MSLTLEQEFAIASFKSTVEKMSHDQRGDMLLMMFEHHLAREAMIKKMAGEKLAQGLPLI